MKFYINSLILIFTLIFVLIECSKLKPTISIEINNNNQFESSSSGSNNIDKNYNYMSTTKNNIQLSKDCPSTDSMDFYKVGECIDGFMYECLNNQSVAILSFGDFQCSELNTTETYPFGCSNTNANTTTYYNCVEEIELISNSYVLSTFGSHGCDNTKLIHQRYTKLDNCASDMYPIIYGTCNSTTYTYTFYNSTTCDSPLYQMEDTLNNCVNSDVFEQSYLSQCI